MSDYTIIYDYTKTKQLTAKVSYFDITLQKEVSMYLCSKIDPIKEAVRWAEEIYSKELEGFYVYGLGMGYHIEALAKLLEPWQSLFVIETNLELYQQTKEKGAYDFIESYKLEHGKAIDLIVTESMREITNLLEQAEAGYSRFFAYRPSIKLIPEKFSKLREIIEVYLLEPARADLYQQAILENYQHNNLLEINEPNKYKNISVLFQQINKPIVIVSGGPSLANNCHLLKQVQDEVFIFSTGRTLKMLIEQGIRVDMFCIIDPLKSGTYVQIQGLEKAGIPAVFLNTASYETLKAYEGPSYLAYSKDSPQNQPGIIETGQSVATAMLDLAIKFGGEPILFIGQDLAYTDGKTHAEAARGTQIEDAPNMRKVKGIHGDYLPTTLGFLKFKHWIENKIKQHPEISFINCTADGAYIEGCRHISLELALKEANDKNND